MEDSASKEFNALLANLIQKLNITDPTIIVDAENSMLYTFQSELLTFAQNDCSIDKILRRVILNEKNYKLHGQINRVYKASVVCIFVFVILVFPILKTSV